MMDMEHIDKIINAIEALKRGHSECDDPWYSCPKSKDGCADDSQEGCTCGADYVNNKLDAIIGMVISLRLEKV